MEDRNLYVAHCESMVGVRATSQAKRSEQVRVVNVKLNSHLSKQIHSYCIRIEFRRLVLYNTSICVTIIGFMIHILCQT